MANFFKRLFGGNDDPPEDPDGETAGDQFYQEKSEAMEALLGEEAGWVYHAILGFAVGGPVDVYLYPHPEFGGCGFATKELTQPGGRGTKGFENGPYELVGFTQHPITPTEDEDHPFFQMLLRMRSLLSSIGRYGSQKILKPYDTLEVPGSKGQPNHFLILAPWPEEGLVMELQGREYCLQLVVEVFGEEMRFARNYGTRELIQLLKDRGYWPYSDLDRRMVLGG